MTHHPTELTFQGFQTLVALATLRAGVRRGQYAFNALSRTRPDIADQIRGRYRVDPFYEDENLSVFWQAVEKLWER